MSNIEQMRAVVCHGPQDYRVENIAKPVAGPNELIVKIAACGICAGDCKAYHGAPMFWKGVEPWVKAPVVPGHEFFGTVVEMGPGASEFHCVEMGDLVVAEQIVPCGKCKFCRSGKYWMCEVHNIFGFQQHVAEGGLSEYMRYPANAIVHKIPKTMSLEDAGIIEPLACAIHTVTRGGIELDDVVVIAGAGPLGLMMTQVARLKTPKKLVVVDLVDERLELAKKFGADIVINPKKENAIQIIKDLTDGYGCDVYIENTGHPSGATQGLEMIRKLGRFVEFSVFSAETTVDWSVIGDRKELDIRGSHLGPYSYPIAIDLLARGLCTSKGIVTHNYSIDDWDAAMKIADSMDSIKVLVRPGDYAK